ncbi:MAG: hypothetical protein HYY95_14745, partial [Candidatus Rokubacteria bacterium]|nr:hypothetical protein [Candidatus Rokubacteria bacterium]
LAGLLLIPPPSSGGWLAANLAGLALGLALIVWERNGLRLHRAALAGHGT